MATKQSERKQLVNLWVERDVIRELEERAERAERSRSAEMRLALRRHLERNGNDTDGGTA
jgi:Ribbon-helix-helix protein, copG family